MRLLLIFSSLFVLTTYAQSNKLKNQQDYKLYYEKLFQKLPSFSDKVINLYQPSFYFYVNMSKDSKDMKYILQFLNDSFFIDEKLYNELYNNWIINITSNTKELYETGISKSKKDKILRNSSFKEKNVVLTICPPFRLTESLYVLQFYQHCQGLCNSHSVYVIEYFSKEQQIKILNGGVIMMQ